MLISATILVQVLGCNQVDFVDSPDDFPVGLSYQITEKGFVKFLNEGFVTLIPQIYSYKVPDQVIDVNPFEFRLEDIHVDDVSAPLFRVSYQDNTAILFSVINLDVDLVFQFNAQQNSYPYLHEHGSGKLAVTNFSISIGLSPYVSEECAHHMAVTYSQESASIDKIFIELNSDNSFLYNSIL